MPDRSLASDGPRACGSPPARLWVGLPATLLVVALALAPGCVGVEAIAGILGSRDNNAPGVEMRYAGLEQRRVAVVASLDPALGRRQPELGAALEALLADRLARHVPGIGVLPPADTRAWLEAHPWWETIPAGGVTRGLGVERLVRIEVADFRTRQSGNAAVLEGLLDTAVQVFAAPGHVAGASGTADPDRPVYVDRIRVRHPDDSDLGIPDVQAGNDVEFEGFDGFSTPGGPDEAAIARTLLASWIRRTGPIFYDQDLANQRDRERAKQRADASGAPADATFEGDPRRGEAASSARGGSA